MLVDRAHPVCGLLSVFVVLPSANKADTGRKGNMGGRRFVEYSCHSAPHWRESGGKEVRETDRRTKTDTQQDLCFSQKLVSLTKFMLGVV